MVLASSVILIVIALLVAACFIFSTLLFLILTWAKGCVVDCMIYQLINISILIISCVVFYHFWMKLP